MRSYCRRNLWPTSRRGCRRDQEQFFQPERSDLRDQRFALRAELIDGAYLRDVFAKYGVL
jgi:hypothetical protein